MKGVSVLDLIVIPEIAALCEQIDKIQGEWDGTCRCIECYWNMWHPTSANGRYNNEESKICVSESLNEIKMTHSNSLLCNGYLNYTKFCGEPKR